MRIALVVQGEGRGHMTQALAVKGMVERLGHEIVGVLVGQSSARTLPGFFVEGMGLTPRAFPSPNFITDKDKKGIRIGKSILANLRVAPRYFRSVRLIARSLEEWKAELVLNFYEPLMGLYARLGYKAIPTMAIAHQYVYLHPAYRFPKSGYIQRAALLALTRTTALGARSVLAISMEELPDIPAKKLFVIPPILRRAVFTQTPAQGDYFLVYLLNSGYVEEIMRFHHTHPEVKLQCFTDRRDITEVHHVDSTLSLHPLSEDKFLSLMAGARGYASTAGFESICEAMYLGKPCLMVPVQGHWEQMCNAQDATALGAGIHDSTFAIERLMAYMEAHHKDYTAYRAWVDSCERRFAQALQNTLQEMR